MIKKDGIRKEVLNTIFKGK